MLQYSSLWIQHGIENYFLGERNWFISKVRKYLVTDYLHYKETVIFPVIVLNIKLKPNKTNLTYLTLDPLMMISRNSLKIATESSLSLVLQKLCSAAECNLLHFKNL